MEENQEGCGRADGGGPNAKWIFGVAAVLLGSSCNSLGFVLEKWAHTANIERVQRGRRPWPRLGGLLCSPLWMLGLTISVLTGTPLEILALSVLPLSVAAPMGGWTIIVGQVFAPCILKEPITRLDWVATFLIAAGVVLTATFGSHCSRMYSVEEILKLCGNTLFQAFEVCALLLLLLAFISTRYLIPRYTQDPRNANRLISVCYSLVAGVVGGQSKLVLKAVAEFAEQIVEGDLSDWRTSPWPYVFVVGALIGAASQLSYQNLGMKYWTVVKALPIYFSSLIIFQTTYGGVLYQDYKHMTLTGFIVFPIALVIQVCGVAMLCLRDSPESDVGKIASDSCYADDLTNSAPSPQQQPPSKYETFNVSLPLSNEEMVVSGDSFGKRVFYKGGARIDTKDQDRCGRDQVGACNEKIEVEEAKAASSLEPLHCGDLRAAGTRARPEDAPPVIHASLLGVSQAEHSV